jgi:hypothetical protein
MKKRVLIGLALLILAGCTTGRQVVGNTFQSSSPKMNIRVDDRFKYLGKTSEISRIQPTKGDTESDTGIETVNYVFVPADAQGRLQEFLVIEIVQLLAVEVSSAEVSWLGANTKWSLDYSKVDLDGSEYEYVGRIYIPNPKWKVEQYLKESGYNLPGCLLSATFSRHAFNNLASIRYLRSAGDCNIDSDKDCKRKCIKDILSDEGKAGIQSLREKAFSLFGVKELKAVKQPQEKSEK